MARANITKDESNILVAIGKIETQMDGLRTDVAGARAEIKEINTGITARLLNLEANSLSKLEVNPRLDDIESRLDAIEKKADTTATQLESYWNSIVVAGTVAVALLGFLEFFIHIFVK